MSDQQKTFESWAKDRRMNLKLDSTGAYWHGITCAAWIGWQAAREQDRLDGIREAFRGSRVNWHYL